MVATPSTSRVATMAGLEEARVQHWLDAGLFAKLPQRTADWVARANVLAQLERAGVPLDVLVAAEEADVLERAYIFEFIQKKRSGSSTRQEVLQRAGLDDQLFTRLCYALGFDDTTSFSDDEVDCFLALASCLKDGVPEAMILEVCELWGTQMRFIASAEVVSYDSNLARRIMADADSPIEGAARLAPLTYLIFRTADLLLRPVHSRHLLQAINLQMNEAGQLGIDSRAPGEVEVAIGFVDLTGYTALTEREGDAQAMIYARRLERIVRSVGRTGGPRVVKHLGDGLMLASPSAAGMIDGLLTIVETIRQRENMPNARASATYGPAQTRAGDYFGHTVNVAARVIDWAGPSEVLVTDEVVDQAGRSAHAFREPRDVLLRGIRDPLRIWRVERITKPASPAS